MADSSVMGPTGVGKSTFVDRAVGRPDVGAGHDLMSYTKEMRPVRYPHPDGIRNIVLVDSPGFDDKFMTDVEILREIAHWLCATHNKNIKLSGVLYLHRISDKRVSGAPLRNYHMFKALCGEENFKNVVLVTTMWDEVTEEVGSAREKELQSDLWRSMMNLGSTMQRFDGTTESAWNIINSFSLAPPVQRRPLRIQREMVDEHLPLHRTAAGRAVLATLADLVSGMKGIFRRFANGRRGALKPIPLDTKRPLQRSRSLLSTTAVYNLSFDDETETIRPSDFGTCSTEGYHSSLVRAIPVLQAALGTAELVNIPYLKNVISPSLSMALSIKASLRCYYRAEKDSYRHTPDHDRNAPRTFSSLADGYATG
ncbi:P-loop containing nucleoside triphosphate hydrolase protein [Pisolithus albus]|nr:P-loop containing nucleoside triphosphate hydrolase protein [Pisolithus albus]